VYHLSENRGAAYALNYGISLSSAEWIAIHDADDISINTRFETQINYLKENPAIVAVGSFIEIFSDSGEPSFVDQIHQRYKNSITTFEKIVEDLYKGVPLTHGSVIFSKSAFNKAGRYNTNYRIAYDYELWTRLIEIGPIHNINKILYKYRKNHNSISNSNIETTSSEFLQAATSFIRRKCYSNKITLPNYILYGTKRGCLHFFTTLNNNTCGISKIIYDSIENKKLINKILKYYYSNDIDGVIILGNAPHAEEIRDSLEMAGI
jgi:glycosyltransferase involved in cell wall biosynthesis